MSASEHPSGISFEFFPPNTEAGREKLKGVRDQLAALEPEFFSVTYGAGGSTRERTFNTVQSVSASGICTAPHLSCVGSDRGELRDFACMRRNGRAYAQCRPLPVAADGRSYCNSDSGNPPVWQYDTASTTVFFEYLLR